MSEPDSREDGMDQASACSDFLERVKRIHAQLGIPDDYADNSGLPLCSEPAQLVQAERDYYGRPQRLEANAFRAWSEMKTAAAEAGVALHLISAFRDIDYQCGLILKKLDQGQTIEEILRVNAAPGFSEHHTGRAIDIGTTGCDALVEDFENTEAFQWLSQHATEFGFSLSYPHGNPLGISYEPWHWCYKNDSES